VMMVTITSVRTRNVSQSVACRVVGRTWVINAAWYLLLSCRLALRGNIMLGHVTNCKYFIRYGNGWCNFDISSVMWTHNILIMGSWVVCITGIPDGKPGSPQPTLWSLPPRHASVVPPPERYSGATAGEPKCLPAARDMPL
jgi:hypothetical protein